jgi:hypothetical protein
MKFFNNGLRLLITGGSVAGFLGGWVLLSHSPKPVSAGSSSAASAAVEPLPTALPTLPPLPPIGDSNFAPIQPLPSLPQASLPQTGFRSMMPRFRTGGS